MKIITFKISQGGKEIGTFKLDPITQLCLMADAKCNKKLSLTEYVRESIREHTLQDLYEGTVYCRADNKGVLQTAAAELAATAD